MVHSLLSVSHNHIWYQYHCISILACSTCSGLFQFLVCLDIASVPVFRWYAFEFLWCRPHVVGPCSQSFSGRVWIKWCDRETKLFLTSGVCLQTIDCMWNDWELLSSFLSRWGSPSDTRLCNISKEIYIRNICWSQTSGYGAARFVQSWVKFAYVCWPFPHRTLIFRRRVAECKSCCFDGCWLGSPFCIW